MKTTSFVFVVALTFAFVRPAFAQRVIGNIYPDTPNDSQESSGVRDPGNSADYGVSALAEPDLAPAPREADPEPAAPSYEPSYGGFATESSGSPWMQRPEGAFAQPWVNPSTPATIPMRETPYMSSPSAGFYGRNR
jgi:hypothetical protein